MDNFDNINQLDESEELDNEELSNYSDGSDDYECNMRLNQLGTKNFHIRYQADPNE